MDQKNITGILKTDISDHFPIFIISVKHRLDYSDNQVDWGNLYSISNPNDAYEYFLKVFSGICDLAFSLKTFSVKKEKRCRILG